MSLVNKRQEVKQWLRRAEEWFSSINTEEPTPTDYQVDAFYRHWRGLPARHEDEPLYSWVESKIETSEIWQPYDVETAVRQRPTKEMIKAAAEAHGISPAGLWAIIQVETRGSGYNRDGTLAMLFEGHLFWHYLRSFNVDPQPWSLKYPTIVYPSWTNRYYLGGTREYDRLRVAVSIHPTAAKMSASWGLGQILGAHFRALGFRQVTEFVAHSAESQENQIAMICRFLQINNLISPLNRGDWAAVARGYNGPGYAQNKYHIKLAEAAASW